MRKQTETRHTPGRHGNQIVSRNEILLQQCANISIILFNEDEHIGKDGQSYSRYEKNRKITTRKGNTN
jgi:hypothetical protein